MINKTSISISAKVADLLTSLVGNTLSEEDKSQLYETVFDFYRDLLRGYDSKTINEIQEQLKGVYGKRELYRSSKFIGSYQLQMFQIV